MSETFLTHKCAYACRRKPCAPGGRESAFGPPGMPGCRNEFHKPKQQACCWPSTPALCTNIRTHIKLCGRDPRCQRCPTCHSIPCHSTLSMHTTHTIHHLPCRNSWMHSNGPGLDLEEGQSNIRFPSVGPEFFRPNSAPRSVHAARMACVASGPWRLQRIPQRARKNPQSVS